MDLFDRIFKLHQILSQSHYPVSRIKLQTQLECSRATVNRCLDDLKDYLHAPVEYNRKAGGYQYAKDRKAAYELPGLWFNASELRALLALQQLLSDIQPGLLEAHLAPFKKRIEQILCSKRAGTGRAGKCIRFLGMASRPAEADTFRTVANALLKYRRLRITYHSRSRNATTVRAVSPQRLVHYRSNWYLDAWDHRKRALRSFALERIKQADPVKQPAKKIPASRLDAYFAAGYGIFAGKPKNIAVLKFSAERARWVAEEKWHPRQKGRFESGCYILEVPYSDHRELVMDILKHAPHVEVLAPGSLKKEIKGILGAAIKKCK
ncbi:WYL domain-containing transcriptional regulator [candidate division FCPU426 bacterium]|nr:WYL domain-containing transcriptional regulator [candidate division FCPU426 bacterium]